MTELKDTSIFYKCHLFFQLYLQMLISPHQGTVGKNHP
ncbi:hypothetical protein yrohd0001_5960 [Yersinia rohdei ATCC 43380]|nr:hypothetical protein yrohd0001_5960 [Yersinia rohdei ATCC 43380]